MPPVPPLTMPNGRQASFIYGPNGEPIRHEHAGDGFALPHVIQFAAVYQGAQKTYFHDRWDEARKHSRENSLAMERDAFLQGLMQERKLATASLKWSIEVDDKNDPYEKALAEGMTRIIKRTPHLLRHHYAALDAVWYGRHGVQHQNEWQEIDLPAVQFTPPGMGAPGVMTQRTAPRRCLVTKAHQPVHGDSIGHKHDGTPYVLMYSPEAHRIPGAEVTMTTGGSYGLVLRGGWRERFVIHTHESVSADFFESERGEAIHGCGVRDRIYWLDWLRREYLDWVVTYYERVGLGVNLWYYEAGNDASYQEVERLAREQTRRANIMIPFYGGKTGLGAGGMERVETPIAGAEALLGMVRHIEEQQERYIVGQSLSSGTEGSGLGGTGVAGLHAQTKQLIIKFDADNLSETYTQDWLRPTQFWSFPELRKCQARFKFSVPDPEAAGKLDAVTKVIAFGVTFKADEVRELTGMSTPEPGDEVVPVMQPAAPGEGQPGDEDDEYSQYGYDDDEDTTGRPQEGDEAPEDDDESGQYARGGESEQYASTTRGGEPVATPARQEQIPPRISGADSQFRRYLERERVPGAPQREYLPARREAYPRGDVTPAWVPYQTQGGEVAYRHSTTGLVHRGANEPRLSAQEVHDRHTRALAMPPHVSHIHPDAATMWREIVGENGPEISEAHKLVGAQPGMIVVASPSSDWEDARRVWLFGQGPQLDPNLGMRRRLGRDEQGNLYVENYSLGLRKKYRGGLGGRIFGDQVQAAANAGIKYIQTTAGRGDMMNGYKVWPRLGYDADLYDHEKKRLPPHLQGSQTVLDLYERPGGAEWWEKHGGTTKMKFDLSPGSRSLRVLNASRARRGLPPITHPGEQRAGGYFQLPGQYARDDADQYATPRIRPEIKVNLHPDELDRITRRSQAREMAAMWKRLPPDEEFLAAAEAGVAKKGWYENAANHIANLFGADAERFSRLLAATSPRITVKENLERAVHLWHRWDAAGRPEGKADLAKIIATAPGKKLSTHNQNIIRALTRPDLWISGDKVLSFARNLSGDLYRVTNDAWMAHFSGLDDGDPFKKHHLYSAHSAKIRRVADTLGWKPAEAQETIWSFFRKLAHLQRALKLSPEESLAALTHGHIKHTVDFLDLMRQDDNVRGIVEEITGGRAPERIPAGGGGEGRGAGGAPGPARVQGEPAGGGLLQPGAAGGGAAGHRGPAGQAARPEDTRRAVGGISDVFRTIGHRARQYRSGTRLIKEADEPLTKYLPQPETGMGQQPAQFAKELWEMGKADWAAAGHDPDSWSSVISRNVRYGKPVPDHVRQELAEHEAAYRAKTAAKPDPHPVPRAGDKIIRYVHRDTGDGLMNRAGLDLTRLTDDEHAQLPHLWELGLRQPPQGTTGTFWFTEAGERQHKKLLALLSKAARAGIIRQEATLQGTPSWVSGDGQIALP